MAALHEERYAMEMIENAAKILDGKVDVFLNLDEDGFWAEEIKITLKRPGLELKSL